MIVCKKNIVNRRGEREQLNVYSSSAECKLTGEPHKIIKRGGKTLGYIGLTRDLDTPKASSKRIKIGNKIYAERKYKGIDFFYDWARNNISNYQTIERITELPDTSDATSLKSMIANCSNLKEVVPVIDCRNATELNGFFYNSKNIEKPAKFKNVSKITNADSVYAECKKLAEEGDFTEFINCKSYNSLYRFTSITKVNKLNTSNATDLSLTFAQSRIKECITLDTSKVTDITSIFSNSDIEIVDNYVKYVL